MFALDFNFSGPRLPFPGVLFTPFAGADRSAQRAILYTFRPTAIAALLLRFRVGGFPHAFARDRRAFASDTGAGIAAAAETAADASAAQSPPAIKVESVATRSVPESTPAKLYAPLKHYFAVC